MKRKLFLFLCALLTSVGMWAQKDVTSTYITNATLSEGMSSGWTVNFTGTDKYPHFNSVTQGNNTVGYATEAYAGWNELVNTAYSMTQTITVPAGNYRLVNYSFYRQGINYDTDKTKSLAYLKAGSETVAIKTLGSITAAGYADNMGEGANCFDSKMYRNVVEFTSDGSPIEIGVYGTFDAAYCWCIVGMFELFDLDDAASVSSPTDVTYAITNAGFEYRDLTGWTTEKSSDNKDFWYMNNNALSGKAGIGWVETFEGTGIPNGRAIKQELTGLDNGLYEVTVYGHLQQGSGSDGFYLYANSDRVAIGSTDQDYSVTTNVTDGNLTIKLATDGCNGNWAAFDKVRMKFYGDPLPAYQELLNAKVATAQALVDGNTIPDAAEAALQTVINDNDNVPATFTTIDQFTTAISNIETAYDTYKALETPYSAWQTVKGLADDIAGLEYVETVSGSHTTFTTAIDNQNTAAEASTTAEGLNTASSDLKTAIKTYMSGATLTFVSELDFTCMIENPSFETGDFSGWTNNGMALQSNTSFGKTGTYYAEKWEPADNTKYGVKQTISSLPAGVYVVSAHAKARAVESAKVYAGSEETAVTIADSEADYDVEFVSTGSDVEFGFEGEGNGTGASWLCVDNFTLTYFGYPASEGEKTALASAITTAEGKTLGFENDEYAPYNNIDALTKLAAAKAIDVSTASSLQVVAATTALTDATWTANVAEVNAFSNSGTFSTANGWENSAWVGTEYDYVGVPNGTTITYGNTSGYTLPLKANTIYELRLRHSGWDGNNHDGGGRVSVLLGEDGLNNATYAGNPSDAKGDDSKYRQETFVFKTGAAGNYVFTLTGNGGRTTVKGFTLVTAPASVSVTLNATTGFSTFASPYPLDLRQANLDGAKAYIATSVDGENITFEALDQAVPANTGVLFAGNTEQEVTIPVVESGSPVDGNIFEVNTYGTTFDAEYGYNYYGLKNNTKEFWPFTPSTVAIPSNKAYLKLSSENPARLVISFDEEDPTAINAIEAAEEAEGLKDGKYLIDNKIVIVKNGVKYSANGQILK